MNAKKFLNLLVLVFTLWLTSLAHGGERPNILWIVIDDMSPNFSCYGETTIETPEVDQLAAEGVLFTRASDSRGQERKSARRKSARHERALVFIENLPYLQAAREPLRHVDPVSVNGDAARGTQVEKLP